MLGPTCSHKILYHHVVDGSPWCIIIIPNFVALWTLISIFNIKNIFNDCTIPASHVRIKLLGPPQETKTKLSPCPLYRHLCHILDQFYIQSATLSPLQSMIIAWISGQNIGSNFKVHLLSFHEPVCSLIERKRDAETFSYGYVCFGCLSWIYSLSELLTNTILARECSALKNFCWYIASLLLVGLWIVLIALCNMSSTSLCNQHQYVLFPLLGIIKKKDLSLQIIPLDDDVSQVSITLF